MMQDDVIQRFEARYTEAHAEGRQATAALKDALQKLDDSEARVAELIEARSKLRKQLDREQAEASTREANLKSEISSQRVSTILVDTIMHSVDTSLACNLNVHRGGMGD